MLQDGRRRAERGTDVVIGFVETYGRAKTAEAIGDLEIIPRRVIDDRSPTLEEMNLSAVLARRPQVALVDELAHTNAVDPKDPTANPHRWQDISILLDAGIDVITTVNIQHLESLNDVVTSIIGVRQGETVPDRVVRSAETVELVDMSPQALRRRMAHGNIYSAEKVDAALSHYFREGNLAALRELALLWLADRVEEGLDRYRDEHRISSTWAARERVVVGVSGGPESQAMMRRAARIATRTTSGEWLAVYVSQRDGLTGVSPEQLESLRHSAEHMGGSFHAVVAQNIADGLLDFARGVNATQVLVGASRRGRFAALLQPGVGETVIARSGTIDVHVVTHDYARRGQTGRFVKTAIGRRRLLGGYSLAVLGPTLLAMGLYFTTELHGLPTESMLMLAVVVATALVGGLWPALLAAVLSSIMLNFLFIPPIGTLTIADPENALAIVVFVLTGVAVASVVDASARRTEQAMRARAEANALAVLWHSLLRLGDDRGELLEQARQVFGMTGAAILRGPADGESSVIASAGDAPVGMDQADAHVQIKPGLQLVLRGGPLRAEDRSLLTAYAAHFAVIEERRQAEQESRRAHELAEGNRVRTALLAAVSHDLRTPLAAIKAAITSLRTEDVTWSKADEQELLASAEESVDRLDALVGNLLDMSRLHTQSIHPLLTEVDVAAAVEWALGTIANSECVDIVLADPLPTVSADAGLLERVIANVVENAIKHTPPNTPISVRASARAGPDSRPWVSLRVIDHGDGVPGESLRAIFEPFQRLGDVPRGEGVGLGLAVAKGLLEAMGGSLTAEETPGGGLTMIIDLPAAEQSEEPSAPIAEPSGEEPPTTSGSSGSGPSAPDQISQSERAAHSAEGVPG